MLLSFVIPAYNEEAYLGDCIRSILVQTRGREHLIEIIVVDNGSTDRTRDIAQSFPGVRVVEEPRKGLPYARQAGFIASSGSLIATMDADSRLPRGWAEEVLATFARQPTLAALSGPFLYYDLTVLQRCLVHVFYLVAWLAYVTNRYVLRRGSVIPAGNFVVFRTALQAIGGFDDPVSFSGENTDLARRLRQAGHIRFVFGLKMFSSARRFRPGGMFTVAGTRATAF